jgi:hypothetical protein
MDIRHILRWPYNTIYCTDKCATTLSRCALAERWRCRLTFAIRRRRGRRPFNFARHERARRIGRRTTLERADR